MGINLDRYYNRELDREKYPQFQNYKELLFRAGDALQSSEINEIQSNLREDINFLARHLIVNGEIVQGCKVNIELIDNNETDEEGRKLHDIKVIATEGFIFADGYFVYVYPGELLVKSQYVPESDFFLGIEIETKIISNENDQDLTDPAKETKNYKQPGACRLQKTGRWTLEEDAQEDSEIFKFLRIFRIKRGEIYDKDSNDEKTDNEETSFRKNVIDIVAKYDRNSNGNYLIQGYEVKFLERIPQDDGSGNLVVNQLGPFKMSIAEGSANVNGYNFEVDVSQEIEVPALIDFELKRSEPVNFTGDGWYKTRHKPIRKIFRISGQKTVIGQDITHGSFAGASDELPNDLQPVISIQRVYQGNTEYIQGVDYKLSGDSIEWLGNNEPAPSTTYKVDFRYQLTETEGNFSGNNAKISDDYSSFYLEGFTPGESVYIDYDFVLKRIDVIYMDSSGRMNVLQGTPREHDPYAPAFDRESNLGISEILLQGDADPEVTISTQRVFKMSDIQLLLDSIQANEYNITRLALQQNIQESQPGATLNNMFVDSFDDDTLRDAGLEAEENTPKALTIGGNLVMGIDWDVKILEPDINIPEEQMSIEIPADSSYLLLSQPHYTKNRQINEYLFKSPPSAKIDIYPKIYKWVSETHYKKFVKQIQTSTRYINTWTTRFRWFGTHRWHQVIKNQVTRQSTSRQILSTSSRTSTSISLSRTPAIVPRINIRINSGYDFNSHEDVKIYLDNKYAGTIKADANGRISGYFRVPSRVVSGSKEVKAIGTNTGIVGTTLFKAEPLSRTIQTTYFQWWRWVVRRQGIIWREADPVAQSFIVSRDTSLDRIEIVFDVLPVTDVSCVVCETTAGMPDKNKTLISKTLSPSELLPAGSKQPFVFDNKIVLNKGKEYAFIIICKDSVGRVRVARLGEKTKDYPHFWLTGQAYSVGTLYNSSNNSAWTPLQEEDMQFWIYGTKFKKEYTIPFKTINVTDATDIMLLANSEDRMGTATNFKVILLDRDENDVAPREFTLNAYSQIPLERSYTGRIKVLVILSSNNGYFTPVLDPNVQISIGNSKRNSIYISRGWIFDPVKDKKITVHIDNYKPSNTNIGIQVQIYSDFENNVYQWVDLNLLESNPIGNDWVESKYEIDLSGFTIDQAQNISRVKINMITSDDANRPVISNLRLNTSTI